MAAKIRYNAYGTLPQFAGPPTTKDGVAVTDELILHTVHGLIQLEKSAAGKDPPQGPGLFRRFVAACIAFRPLWANVDEISVLSEHRLITDGGIIPLEIIAITRRAVVERNGEWKFVDPAYHVCDVPRFGPTVTQQGSWELPGYQLD